MTIGGCERQGIDTMSVVVDDVPAVHVASDIALALFTLSLLSAQ